MKNKLFTTRKLVYASLFVALSIVLKISSMTFLQTLRIGLAEVPVIVAGIVMGPVSGGLIGLVADFVGVMLGSQGPYFPGFSISAFFWGFIPGLLAHKSYREQGSISLGRLLGLLVLTRLLVAIGLNTFWLSILFKKAYIILLYDRLLLSLVQLPVEFYLINIILRRIGNKI